MSKPLLYVYDSYRTASQEWKSLLDPARPQSIRNKPTDCWMIGLILKLSDVEDLHESHFDGAFSYFASSGFTFASTPSNWKVIERALTRRGMVFIPAVGPGYDDTRIRPWNTRNFKSRENGKYFSSLFAHAIDANVPILSITV